MTAEAWHRTKDILYTAASMEVPAREAYLAEACGGDGELRREVERLLAALEEAGTFLEPGVAGELQTGSRVGHYRILEETGRGGMGVVYRAVRDDDYRQEVALKLVKPEIESGLSTLRFRQERQALALLNHPHIARLLDGGTTADGRPYLVMEWAAGQPITGYCEERRLPLAERLRLFLGVCDAVSHAHRNLVVHRDLKPSNIVITQEGEPKLLDFGLAKIFQPALEVGPETSSLAEGRILTPEYASPEQVRGSAVTTATDIYSLGAVLYEMLAGCGPHRFSRRTAAEIEEVVCRGAIARPSAAAAEGGVRGVELRGDLDTIILKALEKDAARRYSHVEEFAGDIRRHLEGRPVLARPASLWYRASKFTRRNKLAVGAAAAVVLAVTAGLLAAIGQARAAGRARAVAERRFELARELAGSLLFEVHDQIADLAGSSKAREVLLAGSLRYLDALSREAGSSPALQRDLAAGYERVAALQGAAGLTNLGYGGAARDNLEKALALRRNVLASNPRSFDYRHELAVTMRQFNNLQIGGTEKLRYARAALDLSEALILEQPGNAGLRQEGAIAEYGMMVALTELGRFPEAIEYSRKALAHSAGSEPVNIALYHKRLGALLLRTRDFAGGVQEYRAAADLDEARVRANPSNGRAKMDLSFDYSDWGWALTATGNLRLGVEQYRKAEGLRADLAAADPRDARAAKGLVSIEWRLAAALAEVGDRKGSQQEFQKAVAYAQSMIDTFSDKQMGRAALADVSRMYGRCWAIQWGSCERARLWFGRARDLYREVGNSAQSGLVEQDMAKCGAKE